MNTIHKKKKTRLNLPPHSNQSYPLTHQGAASKPFVIALVSIAAVVILIILLFLGKQLVGKAFYIGEVNTAGFEDIPLIASTTPFTATVKANVGVGETVAISFELDLPEGISCTGVENLLGWNEDMLVLSTAQCRGSTVTFEYATMNWEEAKTGEFVVARIAFDGISAEGTYRLDFTDFDIISLDEETVDFITEGLDAEITVEIEAPACTVASLASCLTQNECEAAPGVWVVPTKEGELARCVQCTSNAQCSEDQICRENVCIARPVCSATAYENCLDQGECEAANGFWTGQSCDSCGNAQVESSYLEQCDDGNTDERDECNNVCGFTVCSDGIIQSPNGEGQNEQCDDDNKISGDGCSYADGTDEESCVIEDDFSCSGEPSVCTEMVTCTIDDDCEGDSICREGVCMAPPDSDNDGVLDGDDRCPGFDDRADADGDRMPDDCDDNDNDGPDGDVDSDRVKNQDDNCPDATNPAQQDTDGDGIGDVCETVPEPAPEGIGGRYSTLITATNDISVATVYTILRDSQGIILVFKSERMENIAIGQTYTATASYPFPARVATKEVVVRDKLPDQGWTVHGQFTEDVTAPATPATTGTGLTLLTTSSR